MLQLNGRRRKRPRFRVKKLVGRGWRILSQKVGSGWQLETDFGLRVSFDCHWFVDISLPTFYRNSVRGICGNLNEDPDDDCDGCDDVSYCPGGDTEVVDSCAMTTP